MNFKEINDIIQGTSNILENEFIEHSIKKAKQKDKYACISCKSSDGLHLYSDTNTSHCYSCGSTYNVVSFLMNVQGTNYIETIKYLDTKYNLGLPIKKTKKDKELIELNKKLKVYKKKLISDVEREYKNFKEVYDNVIDKIRNLENKDESESLEKTYFSMLFEKHNKLKNHKEYVNNLTLDDVDINELLEIKLLHPKQAKFIDDKLDLLDKANVENREVFKKHFENLKVNEYINYSKYKPNKVINVNEFISENNKLEKLLKVKYSLLIAPTGSGKTYSILNLFKDMEKLLKKQNKKLCFVVPNATQVEQIQTEYGIKGAWDTKDKDLVFMQNTISCYTWNKFGDIEEDLSNTIVVLDEIHQIYQDMYRKNTIDKMVKNLKKCSNRIDITATPDKVNFKDYDFILEYKQKIQTNHNVNVYKNINDDEVLDIINNASGKVALFKDDKGYLESIAKRSNKKYSVVTADDKDTNTTYLNIVKNAHIGDIELLCNTSVIVAGVNIKEPNMTDIILIGVKDKAHIKQYVARFRGLKNVNVHIFNNYKDISEVYEIENYIKYLIDETQITCNRLNIGRVEHMESIINTDHLLFTSLQRESMVYKENGIYKVDTIGIRNKAYSSYYRNSDIVSFINSLEEYFTDIKRINNYKIESEEIKEDKKEATKQAKEHLEILEKHKNYLVGYYDIKKGRVKTETSDHLKANKLTKEKVIEYVENNGLTEMLENSKVKKQITGFTDLVTKKKYSPNLAYKLQTMNNKTKANLFEKVNVLLYEEIKKECKELLDTNTMEVKLYDFILDEFPLDTTYTDEDIDIALNKLYEKHNIKLTNQKLQNYLRYVYIIDKKRIRENKSVHTSDYKYNKNNNSNYAQNKNSQITVHKIIEYQDLDTICKEYGLDTIDKKCIKSIMDKKIDLIKIKKDKIQEIINIFN